MGRLLGAYDSDELDRPDLNKCPDCGCYFATEECPLCGKLCPEEMRAGNRAPVKRSKRRTNSSGRVQFIPWYYSWWFIVIMIAVFPLAGIILFITSPHSRRSKIIGAVIGILYFVLIQMGVGWMLIDMAIPDEPLVDTSVSREVYMNSCLPMEAETFCRLKDNEEVTARIELTVKERVVDAYDESGYGVYYLCVDPKDERVSLLVRDCRIEAEENFLAGDRLIVYGEGGGEALVYTDSYTEITAPCLHMAYAERVE